jgi:crossover junction endodeoxyribonuclease RuvC
MRVFGIDCGTECTGYGIVECDSARSSQLISLGAGGIRLSRKDPLPQRLALVYTTLLTLLEAHQPDIVAIEEVFYSVNAKSALKLGQVRGVALLAAATAHLPTVTGYGLAQKEQVQFMVARLLNLTSVPDPADAADALAIAICHIHHAQTLALQTANL